MPGTCGTPSGRQRGRPPRSLLTAAACRRPGIAGGGVAADRAAAGWAAAGAGLGATAGARREAAWTPPPAEAPPPPGTQREWPQAWPPSVSALMRRFEATTPAPVAGRAVRRFGRRFARRFGPARFPAGARSARRGRARRQRSAEPETLRGAWPSPMAPPGAQHPRHPGCPIFQNQPRHRNHKSGPTALSAISASP